MCQQEYCASLHSPRKQHDRQGGMGDVGEANGDCAGMELFESSSSDYPSF